MSSVLNEYAAIPDAEASARPDWDRLPVQHDPGRDRLLL